MFGMIVMSQEVTQMSSFSYFVGQRIKKYRKSRGYTIEQFSAMINKSKATLSKYETAPLPSTSRRCTTSPRPWTST